MVWVEKRSGILGAEFQNWDVHICIRKWYGLYIGKWNVYDGQFKGLPPTPPNDILLIIVRFWTIKSDFRPRRKLSKKLKHLEDYFQY